MKVLQIQEPWKIGITIKDQPEINEGEALLQVKYCGICGADVASYTGNQPFTTYPRIPGHEFSAQIVALKDTNSNFEVGELVTANPYFNCRTCYSCRRGFVNCCTDNQTMGVQRDGSFAEYIVMPVERLFHGKGLSAQELALIEPFSISYHALSRASVSPTDRVLIIGSGPIGIFALISAKLRGARVYMADVLDGRLEVAKQYGADGVINTKEQSIKEAVDTFTKGDGFDLCVEACGLADTFLSCVEAAAFAGKIILIGNGKKEATFNHSILLKKELNLYGSRNAYSHDFRDLIDLVASKRVDLMPLISEVYSADEATEAFQALTGNDGSLMKVLVRFCDDY